MTTGHVHDALAYADDDELLRVLVPFLLDGAEAGEQVVVALGERTGALVRAALPADTGAGFLASGDMYTRPTTVIRSFRQMLTEHVARGAARIRVVGEVPAAGLGASWDWWARYESAANHAYAEYPLWSVCAYDTRVAPAAVLQDVARTHPRFARADGRSVPSRAYEEPAAYLSEIREPAPDPIQAVRPLVELVDPTPAEARRAVHEAYFGQLPEADVDYLMVAVSETVTNALSYGRRPVEFRAWAGPDRIVVTVSDRGEGPSNPFAGLLPAPPGTTGGHGLWITHQACSHVAAGRTDQGWTIRLTAGTPPA